MKKNYQASSFQIPKQVVATVYSKRFAYFVIRVFH